MIKKGVLTVVIYDGNEYIPDMIIIISIFALLTAIVATIAAKDIIWDRKKTKWIKLTGHGYVFIICSLCLVALPAVQYWLQNQLDEKKENARKIEQVDHDKQLREDYQRSVTKLQTAFGDSNYRTLAVIGKTLAGYKLALDTAERKLHKLFQDSANIKTILPEQPVLELALNGDHGPLRFLKFENGKNHYELNFLSKDAASCCYDLKISAVVNYPDMATHESSNLFYKGPIQVLLEKSDAMAKDNSQYWTFSIDNVQEYDRLLVWVRGTYYDREAKKPYKIDMVYYNLKSSNVFGTMGSGTAAHVREVVNKLEKRN